MKLILYRSRIIINNNYNLSIRYSEKQFNVNQVYKYLPNNIAITDVNWTGFYFIHLNDLVYYLKSQ